MNRARASFTTWWQLARSEMQGHKTDEVRPHRASLLPAHLRNDIPIVSATTVLSCAFGALSGMLQLLRQPVNEVATRRESVTISFRLQNSLAEVVYSLMFIRDACVSGTALEKVSRLVSASTIVDRKSRHTQLDHSPSTLESRGEHTRASAHASWPMATTGGNSLPEIVARYVVRLDSESEPEQCVVV